MNVKEAEERRRVAEIVLGHALEGRDRVAELGTAERAKSSPAQAGRTAGVFSLIIAYMQRLAFREDADTKADEREAIEEEALAEEAERKAAEEKLAAAAAARQKETRYTVEEQAMAKAQARAAAQERSEADLAHERSRNQELEHQLAARADEQNLLAQERARAQALEQQLAARADEQKLLAQERAHNQALEQRLSIRQNDQKLLAPEAPGGLEAARLMEQARLLLDQGNITAARSVLERAAESGSTLALFLLAETYDPAILSAWGIFSVWGIFGRRGNVTKARKLYAKAIVGGVHEAKYRLSALRTRVIERRHRLDDAVDWAIESGWLRRRFESAD